MADYSFEVSESKPMGVPEQYAGHSLLKDQPFFFLPARLRAEIEKEIGTSAFDADLWNLEKDLAEACGSGTFVGVWRSLLVESILLRPVPEISDAQLAGLTNEQKALVRRGTARSNRLSSANRGYSGWLLTNHAFLTEQSTLFRTWKSAVDEYGLAKLSPMFPDVEHVTGTERAIKDDLRDGRAAFETFYVRWRLQGMAAPYLPEPLPPQLPVAILHRVLGYMRHGGQTFYLPDTFPIPTRDEFRDIVEDALRGGNTPEHLDSWTRVVRAKNAAKNKIPRFARLFQLQHYWRALYQRHGENLQGRTGAVQQAFATFLNTSLDTIRKDLAYISRQLGEDWFLVHEQAPD